MPDILPAGVAERQGDRPQRLRDGERVIADRIAEATILFSDLVDVTAPAARLPPERTIALLGALFADFEAGYRCGSVTARWVLT